MIHEYSSWLKESQDNFLHLLTAKQIEWCNKYITDIWKVNEKGEVYTLSGTIAFRYKTFKRFEVQFADTKGNFNCDYSTKLVSLEGSPKKVGRHFYCDNCPNLVSLKGAPIEVKGGFDCYNCPKLLSLEGASREVGEYFDCDECPKINPKELELLEDEKLFKIWLKAGTPPVDEFLDPKSKWRGLVTGRKFDI